MKNKIHIFSFILVVFFYIGCESAFEFELPDSNSKTDSFLPQADFSYELTIGDFSNVKFTDLSFESINYEWDFGGGNTSTEQDPTFRFDGEGSYPVSLTVSDANGASDIITKDVSVVEPELPPVPDPDLVNSDFDKLAKSSGSDCSCSAWINKSIGEQGESSSGNGGSDNVVKFDNAEPDHVYQEFAVTPNADYTISIATSFKGLESGAFPSMLELRILAGSGYEQGYDPVYYEETTEFPQDNWGYSTLAQVENADNNLFVSTISNPEDDSYIIENYTFNSGNNESVALFIRGVGNAEPPEDPADFAMYGYCSGEEEIRLDFVKITANN